MPSTEDTISRSTHVTRAQPLEIVTTVPAQLLGAVMVVRLVGELDLSNATAVQDQLADLLAYRPTADVVLDLSGLSFMDCSGLRVLLEMRRMLTVGRRRLSLRGTRPGVQMLLRVARHEDLLDGTTPPS